MSASKNRLGRWLKRHSLTLVAALGGAAGVAYAAGWHGKTTETAAKVVHVVTTTKTAPSEVRDNVQDTVQIALLLDTSGSMDGLINQARSHLWNMVDKMGRMTRVVNGKTRGVKIELALYEYGNDALSKETGFIRQVQPFTGDLDMVSEKLHGLFTVLLRRPLDLRFRELQTLGQAQRSRGEIPAARYKSCADLMISGMKSLRMVISELCFAKSRASTVEPSGFTRSPSMVSPEKS